MADPVAGRAPAASTPTLRRELGKWDLTAIGVNQVIGGAVFALPAALAASAGGWSPWMVAAVGFASLLIALSFAEVASRFDGTGGSYLYTRAAFGRFAAFEVGWLMWFTRAASWASVINVLAVSLGFYWPSLTAGTPRMLLHDRDHRHARGDQYPRHPSEQLRASMRSPSARSRRSSSSSPPASSSLIGRRLPPGNCPRWPACRRPRCC